jgi:hypothetical protein
VRQVLTWRDEGSQTAALSVLAVGPSRVIVAVGDDCREKMCARIDDAARKAGSALGSILNVRELAPQAFRHRWVRGSDSGEGRNTYLFGCTVLEEVEGAGVSDDTRTIEKCRMY